MAYVVPTAISNRTPNFGTYRKHTYIITATPEMRKEIDGGSKIHEQSTMQVNQVDSYLK